MAKGAGFLLAELEPECETSIGGAATLDFADLGFWQVRSLLEERGTTDGSALIARGRATLASEPALRAQNQQFEEFYRTTGKSLPAHWWDLPASYVCWSYAASGDAALLVVELEAKAVAPRDRFSAAWLGVYCLGKEGNLVFLGPDTMPEPFRDSIRFYRHSLHVVGTPDTLPIVLYTYYALRPRTGRYEYYDYSLAPPPQLGSRANAHASNSGPKPSAPPLVDRSSPLPTRATGKAIMEFCRRAAPVARRDVLLDTC